MAKHDQIPKYHKLMNPLLKALHELGGSGSIEEISSRVSESLDLPEDVLSIPHDPEKSSQTELEYRLAWARTYLKRYGILDNSERGVWVIVPDKREVRAVNPQEVVKTVRDMIRKDREENKTAGQTEEELPEEAETWRNKLHYVLTKELSPDSFERLIKRLLRESGFVQVEVTGRTGDGGIDGKGIIRVGGLLSFHAKIKVEIKVSGLHYDSKIKVSGLHYDSIVSFNFIIVFNSSGLSLNRFSCLRLF